MLKHVKTAALVQVTAFETWRNGADEMVLNPAQYSFVVVHDDDDDFKVSYMTWLNMNAEFE